LRIADFLEEMQRVLVDSVFTIWNIPLIADKTQPGLYWEKDPNLKLVSIGVYFKRFFTSFGFAMNLSNSCETFQFINPCGMKSENIKSLEMLGADPRLKKEFIQCYSSAWLEILEKKYPAPNSKKVRWI
jgi:lipoyl(octanoyl) transferase